MKFLDWLFATGNLLAGIYAVAEFVKSGEGFLLILGLVLLGVATAFVMTDHTQ